MSAILKRHIEKIVNPVHAFENRKAQWREELFGHLSDLLRECEGDEACALRRFGDAAMIRQDLQRSVTFWERIAALQLFPDPPREWNRKFFRRPGESNIGYSCRMAAYLWIAQSLVFFLGIVIGTLCRVVTGDYTEYVTRTVGVGLPLAVMTFLTLGPSIAFAASRARLPRLIVGGVALSLWLFLVMLAFTAFQNRLGYLLYSDHYGDMAVRAILVPVIFRWLGAIMRREHFQYTRWRDMEPMTG